MRHLIKSNMCTLKYWIGNLTPIYAICHKILYFITSVFLFLQTDKIKEVFPVFAFPIYYHILQYMTTKKKKKKINVVQRTILRYLNVRNYFIHLVYHASLSHKDKSHVRELHVKPNFMWKKRYSILGIYIVNIFTMNATLISNHLFLLGSDHFHLFNLKFIHKLWTLLSKNLHMFTKCGYWFSQFKWHEILV